MAVVWIALLAIWRWGWVRVTGDDAGLVLPRCLLSYHYPKPTIWGRGNGGCVATHTQITRSRSARHLSDMDFVTVTPAHEAFDLNCNFSETAAGSVSGHDSAALVTRNVVSAAFAASKLISGARHTLSATQNFLWFFSFLAAEHHQTMTNRVSGNLLFTDVYLDFHSQNRGGRGGSVPHSSATLGKS